MIKLFLLSAFSDFFPASSCISQLTNPLTNYHVFDCQFFHLTRSANGGVIAFSSVAVQVVIESCIFHNCSVTTTSFNGGAIFFSCNPGSLVLSKICASRCQITGSSSKHGLFLYSSAGNQNIILMLSLYHSVQTVVGSQQSPIFMDLGIQQVKYLNSSYNSANKYSVMYSVSSSELLHEFNNYVHCRTNSFSAVHLSNSPTNLIRNCNFFNNTSPEVVTGGVLTCTTTQFNVYACVFAQNYNILLFGNISVSNSWIQHNETISSGLVSILSSTISTESVAPTYEIFHFSTAFCMIPTPAPTIQPTLENMFCTPAQTIPPLPTECYYTDQNMKILSLKSILNFASLATIIPIYGM